MKCLKRILLGIVVLSTSQATAKADDEAATEIRLLKAQLEKSEQRIDAGGATIEAPPVTNFK